MKKSALADNLAEEEAIRARAQAVARFVMPPEHSLADVLTQCLSSTKAAVAAGCIEWPVTHAVYRVTHIPIKPKSMPAIVKIANSPDFVAHTKTFYGFLGVEVLAVGDDTMLTCSRWADTAACDNGAAALGGVLKGFLSAHVAGPPKPPAVGPPLLRMVFRPALRKTVYRTVTFTFKDEAAVMSAIKHIRAKEIETRVFAGIDGLADLTLVAGPKEKQPTVVALAGYDTMASLDAASPKIKEVMMELGAYYASPPTPAAGTLEYQLPLLRPYYRITSVPIKPKSMPTIVEIANLPEFLTHVDSFVGFLGVELLAVGDDTVLVCSRWADKAACDKGAPVLGGVLLSLMGTLQVRGAELLAVGVPLVQMILKPGLKKTAYRTVTFTFTDKAALAAALKFIEGKYPAFDAIDGLADLTLVAGPSGKQPTVVVLAGYDTMASLDAASPKIKDVMMELARWPFLTRPVTVELGAYYASPPTPAAGTLEWSRQ